MAAEWKIKHMPTSNFDDDQKTANIVDFPLDRFYRLQSSYTYMELIKKALGIVSEPFKMLGRQRLHIPKL